MSDLDHHAGYHAQAEAALRRALSLLDDLGLTHEAALVSQALEIMVADVTHATRAGAE